MMMFSNARNCEVVIGGASLGYKLGREFKGRKAMPNISDSIIHARSVVFAAL